MKPLAHAPQACVASKFGGQMLQLAPCQRFVQVHEQPVRMLPLTLCALLEQSATVHRGAHWG